MATWYVRGGATFNGDGTTDAAAASPGAVGAYNIPPGSPASFGSNDTWRLVGGTTLDMGSAALTTGNNAVIEKFGGGADPIITGANSTLLNSSTATGVSISDIQIVRSGGVSGTGYECGQTTNTNLQRCTITGSQTNISANDAVGLTVNACTIGIASTEYGVRTTQATTTCSNWTISNNTFGGGVAVELQASSAARAAGRYTGLSITGNTFPASAGSAIVMQSVMNLTTGSHTLEVLSSTTIQIAGGTWPAWISGDVIYLTGFTNAANFGERTVVSVVGDTLTVSGTALVVEGPGPDKGAGLIDAARMFVAPDISSNTLTSQSQTPMLLASITGGGRITDNTITGQIGSDYVNAAAIEMIYCKPGLIVDYNTIADSAGTFTVDNAAIFLDGGCDGVVVRHNVISRIARGQNDNSGQGVGFFFARNCRAELNVIENCYRGTWCGGVAGDGNVIANNEYRGNTIAVRVNSQPAAGAFTFSENRFRDNDLNISDDSTSTVNGSWVAQQGKLGYPAAAGRGASRAFLWEVTAGDAAGRVPAVAR